jgi:cysteine synthase B
VYGLRSLEDGFVPPVFDPSALDGKVLVSAGDAVRAARRLTEEEGIFAGISSGAVLHAALMQAKRLQQGDIVCLLADGGWKYLSTGAWVGDAEEAEKRVEETLWW